MEALTPEMLVKAKEAAQAFAQLHKTGNLSDDELENVSGGRFPWKDGHC